MGEEEVDVLDSSLYVGGHGEKSLGWDESVGLFEQFVEFPVIEGLPDVTALAFPFGVVFEEEFVIGPIGCSARLFGRSLAVPEGVEVAHELVFPTGVGAGCGEDG